MKNISYKYCIFFVFLAFTLSGRAQRNVVWVHGLDGDANSWAHYKAVFDAERNINSLKEGYNTSSGIDVAATEVATSMDTYLLTGNKNAQNIGIGHSMGGVMIRDVDKMYTGNNKYFGGIITVASPNYGAPIANSLINGDVQSAATNAYNALISGPINQFPGVIVGLYIYGDFKTTYLSDAFITNDLVQNLWGSPTTNAELQVGSSKMNEIKSYYSAIPKISVLAEETSPVHWRLISSQRDGNDQVFCDSVQMARNVYNAFYVANATIAVGSAVVGFFFPVAWIVTAEATFCATQWVKGRNWIDDSENMWCSLIKSSRMETQQYNVNVYFPCPGAEEMLDLGVQKSMVFKDQPHDCGDYRVETRTRTVMVNYPSDGFLPIYSQELQGVTASSGNRYYIEGANHVEVRNMSNSTLNGVANDGTKLKFNEIFGAPGFFYTPPR